MTDDLSFGLAGPFTYPTTHELKEYDSEKFRLMVKRTDLFWYSEVLYDSEEQVFEAANDLIKADNFVGMVFVERLPRAQKKWFTYE